jgi:hypothetical protein
MKNNIIQPKTRIISIRISEAMLNELEVMAKAIDSTPSGIAYQALEAFLASEANIGNVSESMETEKLKMKLLKSLVEYSNRHREVAISYEMLYKLLKDKNKKGGGIGKLTKLIEA